MSLESAENVVLKTRDVNIFYGEKQAVHNVNFDIYKHRVTAIIGPSGCGKSTLLRMYNRMNDFVETYNILAPHQ